MKTNEAVKNILAKNQKGASVSYEESLIGHSVVVSNSFTRIFGVPENPSRQADKWFGFFRFLDFNIDPIEFYENSIVACLLHDIGKANSGFQDAVNGKRDSQIIRHDHLGGLLLNLDHVKNILKEILKLDHEIVVSSIIGHHLRANKTGNSQPCFGRISIDRATFSLFPNEIASLLNIVSKKFGLPQITDTDIPEQWSFNSPAAFNITLHIEKTTSMLKTFHKELRQNHTRNRLLMAVRTALIIADSVGSGLAREGEDITQWINSAFDESFLLDGSAVENKVIIPRCEQISSQKGGFSWSGFQNAANDFPARSLLLSPCGSGKTLASWRWIASQAQKKPVARIIFLYPTRATAQEGFLDYVSWAPEADASLIHGTSEYALSNMFESPDDSRHGKDFTTQERLFALGYWQRRIFSTTVDQFLGFMQNSYRSVCLLPLLSDSIIVIDEIHSFDKSLFSSLKLFLKSFNATVLCMTASLTKQRISEIEQCEVSILDTSKMNYSDLNDISHVNRYHVQQIEDVADAFQVVERLKDSNKILWVVNTVDRCQDIARRLGIPCYHSRFKLKDREKRHKEVISSFRSSGEPALSITTQVCEMSLDLDADVLISEIAPITSLIQRMGRCNRKSVPENNRIGHVFFYKPLNETPYSRDDLAGTDSFIDKINNHTVSQALLLQLLEEYGPNAPEFERYAAFLECGPWAHSREETLRDSNDFTVHAILDSDVEQYLLFRRQKKPVHGLLLPVPSRNAKRDSRIGSSPLVACASHYSADLGFSKISY